MSKKWFRPLIIIIPLLSILVFTNIYIDPANIFHSDDFDIAMSILNGNNTYLSSDYFDPREVRKNMIENMPKDIECISLGPSVTWGISSELVGTDSFYNLSISGANFYDYLAEFALLDINEVNYKHVIMFVNPYFFDENMYDYGSNDPEFMPYANYMLGVLWDDNTEIPSDNNIDIVKKQISQAFSLTYFQSSITFIEENDSPNLNEDRWGILDNTDTELAYYRPDGSWVPKLVNRTRTVEDVINTSNSYPIEVEFCKGEHINEYSVETFKRLISYLDKRGITVTLYICPLAPALWDRLCNEPDADQYYILDELEGLSLDLSNEYENVMITGSFNPYTVGVTNDDFWDARHIRHERLGYYFDFK